MLACTGKRDPPTGKERRHGGIIFSDEDESDDRQHARGRGRTMVEGQEMCRLVVTACMSEESRDGGDYTVYVMRCVMKGFNNGDGRSGNDPLTWEVRRRYSEFHELHTRLKALGSVNADLPSKNPLSKLLSKVVKSRETGLQEYINAVLEHCSDDQCVLLSKFLKVGRHIKALNSDSSFSSATSSRDMTRHSNPSPPTGPVRRPAVGVGGDGGAGGDAPWHSSDRVPLSTGAGLSYQTFPIL
jgi:hypothetical protein